MNHAAIIRRETAVSMTINGVLSLLLLLAVFDVKRPVAVAAPGPHFLPQAFMVALMGSLVPALLVPRHSTATLSEVVIRALALGIVALVAASGGAWLLCRTQGTAMLSAGLALTLKVLFGAMLAAVVTPVAVRAILVRQEA